MYLRWIWRPNFLVFLASTSLAATILIIGGTMLLRDSHAPLIRMGRGNDLSFLFEGEPLLWWRMKPGLQNVAVNLEKDMNWQYRVSTNDMGLRGPALSPDGTKTRLLAVGDSTVFGAGVNDQESWPAQMQEVLNHKNTERKYEVLNAGTPGYTIYQTLRWLETRGLAFKPSVVLVSAGLNELRNWDNRNDVDRALEDSDLLGIPLKSLETDRFLLNQKARNAKRGSEASMPAEKTTCRMRPDEFEDVLVTMKQLCDTHGVQMLFVVWPIEEEIDKGREHWAGYHALAIQVCQRLEIPVVNLYYPFVKSSGHLYIDLIHGTPKTNRIAAEVIEEALHQLL